MIVVGAGFGDEGKGLTTSFLCSQIINPLVVRFNGGHQAGHTVVHNGKRHVFSSFGSGSLQGVPTYWSKHCTFYPTAFVNEFKLLSNPEIFVNPLCPVTTPYDVYCNQMVEKSQRHGSVGVGFGVTLERHERYYKIFVQDLFFEKILIEKLKNVSNYYGFKLDISEFMDNVSEVKKTIKLRTDEIMGYYNPIFEGAQGILLDQDFGFFPHVTRSNTTTKNALELYPSEEVFYVTRTYQTRHGNGFMSNEGQLVSLVNNKDETNVSHEYQGEFRTSKLDVDLLNYAFQCDGNFSSKLKRNLVITCMDQHPIDVKELLSQIKIKFNNVYTCYGPSLNDLKEFVY